MLDKKVKLFAKLKKAKPPIGKGGLAFYVFGEMD